MSISRKDVHYIAKLARVSLTETEEARLEKDLAEILDYVAKLNQVDTSNIEPTTHVLSLENIFRTDENRPSLQPAEVLRIAPKKSDGFVVVPLVIEGKGDA
ncbi:MAG: Asp-tRNA(Asn)/Glu-tRNA(Gln) amidotransferase subunit GatC [Candidatus Omnitrophica bacterium]|nr:Asp-tRNA(Asn)/Glu-tRNA(Gln) amidotransferase subunit GatC [Candidatus Omnitrophota bacterium]